MVHLEIKIILPASIQDTTPDRSSTGVPGSSPASPCVSLDRPERPPGILLLLLLALDLPCIQLNRDAALVAEQLEQDAHPLAAGDARIEDRLVAPEGSFADADHIAGLQAVEQLAACFGDL